VIVVAVRWYLRFNLSYRDIEELLVERGVEVDHVTVYRWVQRFTPLLADAARFARHAPAPVYHGVLDELVPQAWHHVEPYANNPIEADHSQLKHRLRPMRGLRTDRTAQVIIAGHAFRISGAGTTNSVSTRRPLSGSRLLSPNSPRRSDRTGPRASSDPATQQHRRGQQHEHQRIAHLKADPPP
jgi:transposase-like protein